MEKCLYQLPRNFTAQTLDRSGLSALHLRPGALVELTASDVELIGKAHPRIARAMQKIEAKKLSVGKQAKRDAKIKEHAAKQAKLAERASDQSVAAKHAKRGKEAEGKDDAK